MRCPRWVQVTSLLLAYVRSVAVSSPQADTCGFNPLYADRLLHSICESFPPKALSCLFIYPISPTFAPIPTSLTAVSPSFRIHISFSWSHIPCQHLFYMVLPFLRSLFLAPSLLPPLSFLNTSACHPLHSEIFEICSYRSITTVSLQDALLTPHIPLL